MPQPIKLGLAGGPLIVALILGRVGRIGRQVWHMLVNTNLAFREFGIARFSSPPSAWRRRKILRHRLQRHRFAMAARRLNAPTIAYATVYPLTTLLRILSAQVLAIVLFR